MEILMLERPLKNKKLIFLVFYPGLSYPFLGRDCKVILM